MNEETGIHDKTGKMIKVGDTIQFRLSGKHSGPRLERVERRGKHFVTVHPHVYAKEEVIRLDQHRAEFMVVIGRP